MQNRRVRAYLQNELKCVYTIQILATNPTNLAIALRQIVYTQGMGALKQLQRLGFALALSPAQIPSGGRDPKLPSCQSLLPENPVRLLTRTIG